MIQKPVNRTKPSRYEAARDPVLAEARELLEQDRRRKEYARRKYGKNWATTSTWSMPASTVAKWAVIVICVLIAAPYIFEAIFR